MDGSAVGYPRTCIIAGTDTPADFRTNLDDNDLRDLVAAGRAVISGGVFLTAETATGEGPGEERMGAAATENRTTGALPIGAAGDVGDGWAFAVASPARDITDQVMADNTFNDPPPEGFRFVGVDVALAYSGTGSASAFEVTAKWVGGGNVQRVGFCGVVNGELDQFTDVFAGGSVTGTMCFVVPQQEVGEGVLYVAAGFDIEPVYFATV
jgi:hypothetical protein